MKNYILLSTKFERKIKNVIFFMTLDGKEYFFD